MKTNRGLRTAVLTAGIFVCLCGVVIAASPTHIISGIVATGDGVGVGGVDVIGDNGAGSAVTGADGAYSIIVPNHWDGTLMLSKTGWLITPASKAYSNVSANIAGENYTAYQPTISGYIRNAGGTGLNGATVTADNGGGGATTSTSGYYQITVPYHWSGTVSASLSGYSITAKSFISVTTDQTNQNFIGFKPTISGHVRKSDGMALGGVMITANNGGDDTTTNANGYYEISVPYGWTGTVSASLIGYYFTATSYTDVVADQTNQDFVGSLPKIALSFQDPQGKPVNGVSVTISGFAEPILVNGSYDVSVPYGWSGIITPSKSKTVFEPNVLSLANVTQQTLTVLFSSLYQYSGGRGTLSDPYRIADANDLLYLAAHTQDYVSAFVLTADIDLAGYAVNTAIIAADTDGIGGELFGGVAFKGVFDGGGHRIRNMRIDDPAGADYLGLFGYTQNATIKNLVLEDFSIVPTGYDFQSVYRGGLIGLQESGIIADCHVSGSLTGGRYYIGGLTGYSSGVITRCSADIVINTNQWGSSNIGGLVGLADAIIADSFTLGSVSQGTNNANMGGLVGFVGSATIVRNCYSHCQVTGDHSIGGCIGRLQSTLAVVDNCYSTGVVRGRKPTYLEQYYGGFLGWYAGGIVRNCFWDRQTSGLFMESAAGTPLFTSQMKTRSSFTGAGWDFTNETANGSSDFWRMCVNDVDYPRLNWESIDGDFACPDGVSVEDLDFYVGRWLMGNCSSANNYCGGADINQSGVVDLADWAVFAGNWLKRSFEF